MLLFTVGTIQLAQFCIFERPFHPSLDIYVCIYETLSDRIAFSEIITSEDKIAYIRKTKLKQETEHNVRDKRKYVRSNDKGSTLCTSCISLANALCEWGNFVFVLW